MDIRAGTGHSGWYFTSEEPQRPSQLRVNFSGSQDEKMAPWLFQGAILNPEETWKVALFFLKFIPWIIDCNL
jgi:hypothetical protein